MAGKFENELWLPITRQCAWCSHRLALDTKGDLCDRCADMELAQDFEEDAA